ncbi:MAG: 50S ribosomal protein L9 [Pelagibacteraceae bacterium TMED287]|nr:MAG: 50S ribosomal protein L9 [Pelagibacteraceae bacterium TMED287]|tara:strand:- start:174 stop:632 length:459 start_codon:yes stop_codon:yes gene_type:complete
MKVVLLENLKKLGSIGDIIDVKRGFARNFLISNKKAVYASKENIKEVEKIKSNLKQKDDEKKKIAKEIYQKINNQEFKIEKLSTENKELYGSVKPSEISKVILKNLNIEIKPQNIQLKQEIKSLGNFIAKVELHSEIEAQVNLNVISSETSN